MPKRYVPAKELQAASLIAAAHLVTSDHPVPGIEQLSPPHQLAATATDILKRFSEAFQREFGTSPAQDSADAPD
jgi:hypothetical protein